MAIFNKKNSVQSDKPKTTREVIDSVFNEILEETKKNENQEQAKILSEKINSLKESVETLRTEMVTEKEQAITDLKESHTAKLKEVEESHTAKIEALKNKSGIKEEVEEETEKISLRGVYQTADKWALKHVGGNHETKRFNTVEEAVAYREKNNL